MGFNTGAKLPISATIGDCVGRFNGDSTYFDFNCRVGPHSGDGATANVAFTFADGTDFTVPYKACIWSNDAATRCLHSSAGTRKALYTGLLCDITVGRREG